jgi:hypothetical protein
MGHEAIWCRTRKNLPDDRQRKFPYLLREQKVTQADKVWCTDITWEACTARALLTAVHRGATVLPAGPCPENRRGSGKENSLQY